LIPGYPLSKCANNKQQQPWHALNMLGLSQGYFATACQQQQPGLQQHSQFRLMTALLMTMYVLLCQCSAAAIGAAAVAASAAAVADSR
jgi:hypothetical protein